MTDDNSQWSVMTVWASSAQSNNVCVSYQTVNWAAELQLVTLIVTETHSGFNALVHTFTPYNCLHQS